MYIPSLFTKYKIFALNMYKIFQPGNDIHCSENKADFLEYRGMKSIGKEIY